MSKELIEKLREKADSLTTTVGVMNLLHEAADAIEAKAAPVGEREAFEAWCEESGQYVKSPVVFEAFQAGAAYQRQSGVVMPWRKKAHEYEGMGFWKANGWNDCLDEFARLNGAGSHE